MFKRILLSLGVITVVGGSAIVGTQALLSDNVSLTANTFSTGSVDLQIWDVPTSTYGGATVGFNNTMLPGGTSGPHVFWLKNNGSGVDLAVTAAATLVDIGGGDYSSDDITITITPMLPDGTGPAVGASPVTQTLTAWLSTTALGLPNIPTNEEQRYHMQVTIDPGVTKSSESVSFDFTFTGTQTP